MRILSLVLLACLAGPVVAQQAGETDQSPLRQMTIVGDAKVEVEPDMATISLGVSSEEATAKEAMDKTSAALEKVLARLEAAGIKEWDLQTSGLSLYPIHDNKVLGSFGRPKVVGFVASNTVSARVRDLSKLGGLLDEAISDGANSFNGVKFGLQDPQPQQDEARQNAVTEARRKAELYAQAAGVELGDVLLISEQRSMQSPQMDGGYARGMMRAENGVPIAEGAVSVGATVTLVFEIY